LKGGSREIGSMDMGNFIGRQGRYGKRSTKRNKYKR
jgi:hypothetical protein